MDGTIPNHSRRLQRKYHIRRPDPPQINDLVAKIGSPHTQGLRPYRSLA